MRNEEYIHACNLTEPCYVNIIIKSLCLYYMIATQLGPAGDYANEFPGKISFLSFAMTAALRWGEDSPCQHLFSHPPFRDS